VLPVGTIVVSGISIGSAYAPPAIAAAAGTSRPTPVDTATPAPRGDIVTFSPQAICGAHFGSVAATLDGLARISNALATADTALAADPPASNATFGGKPLLDGTYTVSVNGIALCLSAVNAANVAESRRRIDLYRRDVVGPAVRVALESMRALCPCIDDPAAARTAALLVRAQTLVRPQTTLLAGDGDGDGDGDGPRILALLG
jgi:hypothetical protein